MGNANEATSRPAARRKTKAIVIRNSVREVFAMPQKEFRQVAINADIGLDRKHEHS